MAFSGGAGLLAWAGWFCLGSGRILGLVPGWSIDLVPIQILKTTTQSDTSSQPVRLSLRLLSSHTFLTNSLSLSGKRYVSLVSFSFNCTVP